MVWFGCNIISTILVYFFLPESSGKTMEEMGDLFGDAVVVHMADNGRELVEGESRVDLETFEHRLKEGTKGDVPVAQHTEGA